MILHTTPVTVRQLRDLLLLFDPDLTVHIAGNEHHDDVPLGEMGRRRLRDVHGEETSAEEALVLSG